MNAPTVLTNLEPAVMSLWRDARLLGCAHPLELKPHLSALVEAQDEIARAVEKAKQ